MPSISPEDALVSELRRLDVPFLWAYGFPDVDPIPPADLLLGLAQSSDARVRLAIIPLLLCHPEMADVVVMVSRRLPPDRLIIYECYYTAAVLLQSRYAERLIELGLPAIPLPDLFSSQLHLPESETIDNALIALAARQAELYDNYVNWRGTYEHGALKLIKALERRKQWKNQVQSR